MFESKDRRVYLEITVKCPSLLSIGAYNEVLALFMFCFIFGVKIDSEARNTLNTVFARTCKLHGAMLSGGLVRIFVALIIAK